MKIQRSWPFYLSFLIALFLQIMPLPGFVIWLRPSWILLLMIFWQLQRPGSISPLGIFALGILWDLLTGTILGAHGFALLIVLYVLTRVQRQLTIMPGTQQAGFVLLFSLVNKVGLAIFQGMFGHWTSSVLFWFAALIDAGLWWWLWMLLSDLLIKA